MKRLISRLHLGSILGLFVAGYLALSLAQIVRRNYELRTQITKLESQIMQMEEEKADLRYRIRYYQTDAFKEKEARAKLGLQAPGESVIVLPKQESDDAVSEAETRNLPRKTNPEQWWEFLFG